MAAAKTTRPVLVSIALGFCIAVALTKLGNPVIFESMSYAPQNLAEVVFSNWPDSWGYFVLIPALLFAATKANFKTDLPRWFIALPIIWLFWTWLSSARSTAPELSRLTVIHFTAIVALFFAGLFVPIQRSFFKVVIFGFAYLLWLGLEQHNGGLEATRKAFFEQPNWQELKIPKEFLLRIESTRIFSSFVYANAFAGAILLWAPALVIALWDWTKRLPSIAQKVVVGLFIYCAAACLFWTGSKAGWLIAIAVTAIALLHLPMKRSLKIGIISTALIVGLAGFAVKYRSYFQKGATSASARFIYWQAAVKIANDHPLLGGGPGAFARNFAPIKPPEAEMARLTHNDYLEQACDSGWVPFLVFTSFIGTALFFGHRSVTKSPLHLAVWLGLVAWALQSFVEFGLYIPGISWGAFLLLGWILSIDSPKLAE
jgi:O-antigen ligase